MLVYLLAMNKCSSIQRHRLGLNLDTEIRLASWNSIRLQPSMPMKGPPHISGAYRWHFGHDGHRSVRFRRIGDALLQHLDLGHIFFQLFKVAGRVLLELLDLAAQSVDPVSHDLAAASLAGKLLVDKVGEHEEANHHEDGLHQEHSKQEDGLAISFPLVRTPCVSTIRVVPIRSRLQMLTIHVQMDILSLHS